MMATSQRIEGATPNGGVASEIFYQDANGNPAEKEDAVGGELMEYDANGKVIQRTYFTREP
jgi:antitoxin component YwqK of YwqJK toxin-antitoxin module